MPQDATIRDARIQDATTDTERSFDTPTQEYVPAEGLKTSHQAEERQSHKPYLQFKSGNQVDDFQLLTSLGEGGFAQVFLARQISMQRLVALKISADRGTEPQMLAKLDHRNIVRVFDQRRCEQPLARLLYMEVIPGGTLEDVLSRVQDFAGKPCTGKVLLESIDARLQAAGISAPDDSSQRSWLASASWPLAVCKIGAQLAEGLAYAHRQGVLHRDIKPANVLLTPEGLPKLADFNVSSDCEEAGKDEAGCAGGSLLYMSPEQLQTCHTSLKGSLNRVRETSDIYSLGILLWEMVCGHRPFINDPRNVRSADDLRQMMDIRQNADLEKMADDLPSDCPQSLRQVLIRCLQPRREERYQSADDVARALHLCLEPRCWRLLQEPTTAMGRLLLKMPVSAILLAGLIPNIFVAFFKYRYCEAVILDKMPLLKDRFEVVLIWVNAVAFAMGIAVIAWLARRGWRWLATDDPPLQRKGSRHTLLFGGIASLVFLVLWTTAGVIYPVAIDLSSKGPAPAGFYLHFFLSLVLCGLTAIAYPYFLNTTLAVHCFFPSLVRNGIVAGPRREDLQQLRRVNRLHLALAALVPLLAVLLVVVASASVKKFNPQLQWVLIVVSGVGMLGFVGIFFLERFLDEDIAALEKIAVDEAQTK